MNTFINIRNALLSTSGILVAKRIMSWNQFCIRSVLSFMPSRFYEIKLFDLSLKSHMMSCSKFKKAVTSAKKRIDEFVFLSWRHETWISISNFKYFRVISRQICFSILMTWNLNFDFEFQVFPSHQGRNSFICFLGEVTARQLCFEIYWPLDSMNFVIPLYGLYCCLMTHRN